MVYEPYCANYTIAAELMLAEEQSLMVSLNSISVTFFVGSDICYMVVVAW